MLAHAVEGYLARSSWIRRMFETGIELKRRYGADAVQDLSLGNPDLAPPAVVADALRDLADRAAEPFAFGYMPNAGYPELRAALAEALCAEQGVDLSANHVLVTCGAAGAINVVLRAVLNPGDEVLAIAPYFVEYGFYVENHGGRLVAVPARTPDFGLDLAAVEAAISARTRCVILNSPNNPTGRVYSAEELAALGALLARAEARVGRPILIIADEPYRFLTYDGVRVPSVMAAHPHSVVVSSFSKSLGLAGERLGYAAVNPTMPEADDLMNGMVLANRILGFVNAPAVGQRILMKALGHQVDTAVYVRRRTAMMRLLDEAGIRYVPPQGAFYFFPEAPGGDDEAFVRILQEERILAVPGRGFGMPGYFRLAFCVDEAVIERARDGMIRAVARVRG
ncbi:MAG: pyridoxal phosphate-dependent aminotransferase [Desulfomicrobiaceae bacterium]|nr:pyridoxal phosphate-dependent aminotransferase [Desulfomicrobiaceae bacterium]